MYRPSPSVASSSSAERVPLEQLLAKQDEHLAQLADCSATRVVNELQHQVLLMQRNQKHLADLQRSKEAPRVLDLSAASVHLYNRDRYWGKEDHIRRETQLAAAAAEELAVRPAHARWEKGPSRLEHYTREVKWFYETVFRERVDSDTLPSGAHQLLEESVDRPSTSTSQDTANRLLLQEKIRQLPVLIRQFSGSEDDLFKLLKAKYAAPYYEFMDW